MVIVPLLVVLNLAVGSAPAGPAPPRVELLWPEGAPGAVGREDQDRPSLAIYLPEAAKASGTGIVVCPGGGYAMLSIDHEGRQVARWLNSHGIAAFVLKYRFGPRYRHPAPLQDAQRALRYVRLHAQGLGISPERIGIWGFSAGGHLASTAATHFDRGHPNAGDAVDRMSSRPDFLILAYPVTPSRLPTRIANRSSTFWAITLTRSWSRTSRTSCR